MIPINYPRNLSKFNQDYIDNFQFTESFKRKVVRFFSKKSSLNRV